MRALAVAVVFGVLVAGLSAPLAASKKERCERVASLASAGEHKPAVDEMNVLEKESIKCSKRVRRALAASRATLGEANALVQSAASERQAGDLPGASRDLRKALAVYPKYYWADKQLREVEQAMAAEVEVLRERAAQLESAGELPKALESLETASALAPTDPDLEAGRKQLRRQIADASLELAREAEARGDLLEASRLIAREIDEESHDPDLRRDLVEAARLLGLKLFSEGELTQAKDLWQRALALDSGNQKLREYLREVEQRLESLEEIKTEDNGTRPG